MWGRDWWARFFGWLDVAGSRGGWAWWRRPPGDLTSELSLVSGEAPASV